MNLERFREIARALPHAAETVQWGSNLVLWVCDKKIGGKMFALANTEPGERYVCSFAAGEEGMAELLEREGFFPAPYLARAHWVAVEAWDSLNDAEWRARLARAHGLVFEKLPKRTRAVLAMPATERGRILRARTANPAKPK